MYFFPFGNWVSAFLLHTHTHTRSILIFQPRVSEIGLTGAGSVAPDLWKEIPLGNFWKPRFGNGIMGSRSRSTTSEYISDKKAGLFLSPLDVSHSITMFSLFSSFCRKFAVYSKEQIRVELIVDEVPREINKRETFQIELFGALNDKRALSDESRTRSSHHHHDDT